MKTPELVEQAPVATASGVGLTMDRHSRGRSRWRHARSRSLRHSKRGVAAVIGTLLSLLVFLSIFGIFITQYLPIWMTDNEASYATTVQTQFGTLKHDIDVLTLENIPGRAVSDPITMQSASIPVFATPTQGQLALAPVHGVYLNVSFSLPGVPKFFQNYSSYDLTMTLPDRYYVPVTYAFEDDAVISIQGAPTDVAGQVMDFDPSVIANTTSTPTGSLTHVSLSLFSLYGNTTRGGQSGTQEIYATLLSTQTYTPTPRTGLNIVQATDYPCAWSRFWNSSFQTPGLGFSLYPLPQTACKTNPSGPTIVRVSLTSVTSMQVIVAAIGMSVGIGNPP